LEVEREIVTKKEEGISDSFCIRPDFILEDSDGHVCVVDAKYYTRSLPQKEILKLMADTILLEADGALLILGDKTKLSKKARKILQENDIVVVYDEPKTKKHQSSSTSSSSFKRNLAHGISRCFHPRIESDSKTFQQK
jgi:adenylate kinase